MSALQSAAVWTASILGCGAALWLTWARLRDVPPSRRTALTVLRALSIVCLGLMIIHPVSHRAAMVKRPPRIVVLADASGSMGIKDAPGGGTRFEWMKAALDADGPIGQALSHTQAEWYTFADEPEQVRPPITREPKGFATNLDAALLTAIRDKRPEAVIVISDGAANRGRDPEAIAAWLAQQRVPVYCVGVGSPEPPPDAWLAWVEAPRTVKSGNSCLVRTNVAARGLQGKVASISIAGPGVVRDKGRLLLGGAMEHSVEFAIRPPAPGLHRYHVALAPIPGEHTSANNARTFCLRAVPGQSTLLVIAGQASLEFKFLARAISGLAEVKTTFLVRKARAGFAPLTGGFIGRRIPTGRDLASFDAVVLQDVPMSALTAEEVTALLHYVGDRGGGLGVLGGPNSFSTGGYENSALAPALGVVVRAGEGYSTVPVKAKPSPEAQGAVPFQDVERHEDFPGWPSMPLLDGSNLAAAVRAGAFVALRTDNGAPLVVIQRYGKGRTLCVLTGGTYRWVLSRDATEASRKGHAVFWRALTSWLLTPPNRAPVALETDRDVYEVGDNARLIVQVTDAGFQPVSGARVSVAFKTKNSSGRVILSELAATPGTYEGVLPVRQAGTMHLTASAALGTSVIGTDSREIVVGQSTLELADPAQHVEYLRLIADASGGAYLPAENVALLARVANLVPRAETRTVPFAWSRNGWVLSIFIGLLGLDWLLRRWWGLG